MTTDTEPTDTAMPERTSDEQITHWRATADLDARAGAPVGNALREAVDEVERLRTELARWEGHDALTKTLVQQAEADRDRAEAVCVLLGWTASRQESTREKALHQLWSDWARTKSSDFMDPANHPELSDEVIERLAQQRDEIRACTLAAIRSEEPS